MASNPAAADSPKHTAARGRGRRGWLVALIVLVALVAMAPTLIATTASHNSLLSSLVPAEVGSVTAQSSTVGWTGPLGLTGVEVRDPQGGLIATAERVEAPGGWTSLLGAAAIDIVVTSPVVYATVSPAGSNLEAFAERIEAERNRKRALDGAAGPPADKPKRPVRVRVSSGIVRISDAATGERWQADGVEADVFIGGVGQQSINARGAVAEVDGPRGEFAIEQTGQPATTGPTPQRLAFDLRGVPASLLGAALRRSDPATRVAGVVTGGGQMQWNAGVAPPADASPLDTLIAFAWRSSGEVSVQNAAYSGRPTRGQLVRLAGVAAPWDIAATPEGLSVTRFEPAIDFVRAKVGGVLSARGGQQLSGQLSIDLARLAAIAPEVLSVRDGVRIESGAITATFGLQRADKATRLEIDAKTDGLAGVSPQGPVRWPAPVVLQAVAIGPATLDTMQPTTGWRVESLDFRSRFLSAKAGGDVTQAQGSARLDLAKLATDVGQFLDLGEYRLAGVGEASFNWRREDAGVNRLQARGELQNVLVGAAERPLVQEQQLTFRIDGQANATGLASLVASGELLSGADKLSFNVEPAGGNGERRFTGKLSGAAPSWFRRARLAQPTLPTPEELQLAGAIEATASGSLGEDRGRIDKAKATLTDLVVAPPAAAGEPGGLLLREPLFELTADAAWEPGKLRSSRGQIQSSTVSLSTRDLEITPGAADDWRGQVAFRGDLAKLSQWWLANPTAGAIAAEGQIEGRARLRGVPEGTRFEGDATGAQLRLVRLEAAGPQEIWREPQLRLEGAAMVRPAARADGTTGVAVEIEDLRVASQTVTGSAGGQIDDLERLAGVRLAGGVDYDLEKLSPVLWPKLANSVRLFGKDTARFRVESGAAPAGGTLPAPAEVRQPTGQPTGLATLTGRVEAPWQGADLFGLPVGPGKLGATLSGGVVRLDPLSVQVGQAGQLTTQAAARIAPPPRYAEVAPGPLVTNVSISQQVSERVLKYIAPVLADATRADGQFSIALSEARTPLDQPEMSRVAGQLDVHSVQVRPGPSIAEIVALVRQIRGVVRDGVEGVVQSNERPILTMSDRVIDFTMADGRVYHRGLEFFVGDAMVTSEGSVGVDETLDLLLRVPIQEEWVQQRPILLGGLRGRSIDIPVRGTFKKPEIDREAFRQISRDLLQSAAAGAIDGLLRGLLAPR